MNITELRQALIALNNQLELTEFKDDEAYKKSIRDMTNYLQEKLDNKVASFTERDMRTCLELFSEVRKNINRIDVRRPEAQEEMRVRPAVDRVLNSKRAKAEAQANKAMRVESEDNFDFSYEAGQENAIDESMLIFEDEDAPVQEAAQAPAASAGPISSVKEMVSEIENTIATVDTNKNWNLEACIRNSNRNDLVLDKAPDVVGASSSKRNMISMKYENGLNIDGFFTADGQLFDVDKGRKMENKLRETLADQKYQDNSNIQNFCKNVLKSKYGASSLLLVMALRDRKSKVNYSREEGNIEAGYEMDLLSGFFGRNKKNIHEKFEKVDPQFRQFLTELRNSVEDADVAENNRRLNQYMYGIKAEGKTVLAGRNAAMSTVANILGVPNIVAKSVRATATWKGQHIEGIFTEKAEGLVIPTKEDDLKYTEAMSLEGYAPSYLKSLSELQVLDYICGNVDRHQDNFSYIIENNKIVGIMGLDNDFSFGTKIPEDNDGIGIGVPLNNITVIPEDMAKRILALDDETLRASLNGSGLGKSEIDACIERKNRVQNRLRHSVNELKTGNMKAMKDEDWKNYSLGQFSKVKELDTADNIFEHGKYMVQEAEYLQSMYRRHKPLKKPQPDKKTKKNSAQPAEKSFTKSTRREEIDAKVIKEKLNALKKFSKEFDRVSHAWSVTHTQYKELKEVLDKASKFKPESIMTEAGRKAFEKYLNDVNSKTNAYILYKEPQNDTHQVGKDRLDLAKKLKLYVENEISIFHNASMDFAEKQAEEDIKAYQLENKRVEKIVTVLAEKAIQAHGGNGNLDRAKDLIMENKLFKKLLGSKPETIKEFAELADTNQNKLYKKFSSLLRDYTDSKSANSARFRDEISKDAPANPEAGDGNGLRI